MKTTYNCYRSNLNIENLNGKIIIEGMHWDNYTHLLFEVGNKCIAPFNRKNIKATIYKITESKVFIIFDENQKKKTLTLNEFIQHNRNTHTVIRFEKNGLGPYQSPEKTQELNDLIEHHKNLGSSSRHQPTALHCWKVYSLPEDFKFAFANYQQLYSWFTIEEIRIIIKSGFKLITLQEGRDYVDHIQSMSQAAITNLPNAYDRLHSKQYKDNIY